MPEAKPKKRKRKLSRGQQLNGWAFVMMQSLGHGTTVKVNVLGRVLEGHIVMQRNDVPVGDDKELSSMRYKMRRTTGDHEWFNLNDVEAVAE